MADLPIGAEGSLNGATPVTILAAPAAGKQRITPAFGISVYNADSVAQTITIQKNKGGTITIIERFAGVAAGVSALLAKKVVLDATNESIEAMIGGAPTTTNPTYDVAAMECS